MKSEKEKEKKSKIMFLATEHCIMEADSTCCFEVLLPCDINWIELFLKYKCYIYKKKVNFDLIKA